MTRMARVVVPGYPHYITQRGNRRQQTFFCDDDYRFYLKLLSEHAQNAGTQVWAYCLMPNHVHLVMVPSQEDGLRAVLSEVHRRYTRFINIRGRWCGHLWRERLHSFVMDESYLPVAVRSVERNPVVTGLCENAHCWQWSSAMARIKGEGDGVVDVKPMLDRVDDWRDYLASNAGSSQDMELIKRHAWTGGPLGSKAFIEKLESITGRSFPPCNVGVKLAMGE